MVSHAMTPAAAGAGDGWFRLMFERSADAMTLFDPERGVFIDMNPASLRAAGATSLEQVLNLSPDALSPEFQPDGRTSREVTEDIVRRTFAQGSHRFEWRLRRLDGYEYMVEVVSTAIPHEGRTLILTSARDVSERHRIEAELRAAEERWRQVFEQSPISLQIFAPDGTSRRTNRAFGRLFQLTPEEVAGFNILQDEQLRAAGLAPQLERAFRGEVVLIPAIPFECRARPDQPARGQRWIGSTFFPILDAHGAIQEIVCVHHDETERRAAEEEIRALNQSLEQRIAERTAELRASEDRLRTLVEHAPEAIVVFDGETGRFLECNENACRLFGLSREALLQLGPWDVSPAKQPGGVESRELARKNMERVLSGETPVFEWTHRHTSGRLIPCEVRLVALPSPGRRLVRGSVLDNTERRHRERTQQATFEIASAALAAEELDQFYEQVHEIVRRLMPAENFYIALYDAPAELISFAYHVDQYSPRPDPRPVTTGLTGEVLRLGKPLLVTSDMRERKRQLPAGVIIEGIAELPYEESGRPAATWLGVPLLHQNRPVGVMAVQDYRDARAYGPEDEQLLTFVAAQVALAIERQRATAQLRKSEEKFKSLFELSPLGISQIDWQGRFLQINPAFARMVGRTPEEVLRLSYWDITPREYESQELMVLEEVRKHGHFGPFEKEYLHRDGHRVPIVLHAVLVRAPDGEEQLWGIVEDVTERRRAEQALRESEQNFRALFEASSQGVMLNDENEFLAVNDAGARIFGCTPQDLVGKHPRDLAAPFQLNGEPSGPAARRHISDCLRDGQARFEWLSRRADGTDVPLDVVLTSISLGGRKIIQAMVTDISERKRTEAELLKALARERELSELKSSFVSMVSHEFRTPLGVIQSSAEILHDYLDRLEPDERREHLLSITKNTRRMAGLMEEVLVLGRLDAGKLPFTPAPVDLGLLLAKLVEEVHWATDYLSPIQLHADDLPPLVSVDDKLVTHILSNLLSNAVKYSPAGTPVQVEVGVRNHQLEFCIRDQGIGIPDADQPRLFETFHRGSNVGSRAGTGLGLVIVKRCVELHGGRLELRSRVGEGTTVVVRLPLPLEPEDG